jgi:superfamily I DNA/RNA helicase
VLIDEGHDFDPEWLQLVTQMVDPETDALLLLYDDAQSIYKKGKSMDFSLSSVGIKARGRTTIFKLNYRNTKEILDFAYQFAHEFIAETDSDDDHIPVIAPESAGGTGPDPVFRSFEDENKEFDFVVRCVAKWLKDGRDPKEIAILVPSKKTAETISNKLGTMGIANACLVDNKQKAKYDPNKPLVPIFTIHSSKGLEFETVILPAIEKIQYVAEDISDQVKLIYVGMTRARTELLITSSGHTVYTDRLLDIVAP